MRALAAFSAALALAVGCAAATAWAQDREEPFSGRPLPALLRPSVTVSCVADRASVAGYFTDASLGESETLPKTRLLTSPLKSQPAGGAYRVSISGESAEVVDEGQKQSETYLVYRRSVMGVILVRANGASVETITIDPRVGSFVLTDSGVGPLWNRANVWVGRCHE